MNQSINEKVKVFAEFGRDISDIVPSQFNWGEKEFRVKNARKAIYRNGGNVSYLFSGNDGDTLFFIISGSISVVIEDDEGREMIVAYLNPGDFFGEMGLRSLRFQSPLPARLERRAGL